MARKPSYSSFFSAGCPDFKIEIFVKIHWAPSEVIEVKRSLRSRGHFRGRWGQILGFHLVFTSFHLEFLSFWVSSSFEPFKSPHELSWFWKFQNSILKNAKTIHSPAPISEYPVPLCTFCLFSVSAFTSPKFIQDPTFICFCSIFHSLRLFPALRLFRSLE